MADKVYVLLEHNYGGEKYVLSVFSTQELAHEALMKRAGKHRRFFGHTHSVAVVHRIIDQDTEEFEEDG